MRHPRDCAAEGAKRLSRAGIDSARADARILLSHAMGMAGAIPTGDVAEPECDRFFSMIARRERSEPLAYIVGFREFWSLPFEVGPGVLIPRPETETLVAAALQAFPERSAALRVLDLGTGTGCLPIAFLSEFPNACAIAIDSSSEALKWANRNVERHRLRARCELRQAVWSDGVGGTFDVIFSNPPYIETGTIPGLAPDVADFEPRSALDGGPDGLEAYRALALRLPKRLNAHGRAFVELGAGQSKMVRAVFAAGGLETVELVTDLSGVERCLVAATVA